MSDKNNNYEWLGDDVSESELTGEKDIIAKELMGEEYSKFMIIRLKLIENIFHRYLTYRMDHQV